MKTGSLDLKKNKSAFQFSDPVIKESLFLANDDFKNENNLEESIKIDSSAETPKKDDNNYFQSTVTVRVYNVDLNEIEDNNSYPFFLNVVMQSQFKWKQSDDLNDKKIKRMLSNKAPALIISYMRPYITALTNNTEFETLYIPFINFENEN